jgi:hypothetical protein
MKSTFGEILFATVLSCVAAGLAAVAGIAAGVFLAGWLNGRGMWADAYIVLIGMMLLMPVGVFVLVFWKIIHYGAPDSLPSSK